MVEIIDKVVDKAKDAKDKVVDTTKDVVDAAKDSMSSSPSSSQPSFSHSQEKNHKESDQGIETKRIQVPLNAHIKEESLASGDLKIDAPSSDTAAVATPTDTAAVATPTDTAISTIQVNQKNNSYKETNELFNPFLIGIKLWQNYSAIWMDFYKEMLNYNSRMIKNFRN